MLCPEYKLTRLVTLESGRGATITGSPSMTISPDLASLHPEGSVGSSNQRRPEDSDLLSAILVRVLEHWGMDNACLTGETNLEERVRIIDTFSSSAAAQVLLSSTRAAGVGYVLDVSTFDEAKIADLRTHSTR